MNNITDKKLILESNIKSIEKKVIATLRKLEIPELDPNYMKRPVGQRKGYYDSGWKVSVQRNYEMKGGPFTDPWTSDVVIIDFEVPYAAASNTRQRVRDWAMKATREFAKSYLVYSPGYSDRIIIRPR